VISKKTAAIVAACGVALSGLAMVPAQAEPVSNTYAIVGSDTLEDVVGAIVNGTNITGNSVRLYTSDNASLGSFDATGTPYIITKPNGARFGRPNGSGDGVKALSRSIDGAAFTSGTTGGPTAVTITGQVDIARSSSAGTLNANGELIYIPFGRDAIAYAYGATDGTTAMATNLDSLTLAQLADLYTCGGSTTATSQTFGGQTVTAYIPQSGSGTRKDFLSKIGKTEGDIAAAITSGCVKVGQEHDASTLATNSIMPMSASRWIAMSNGASFKKQSAVANIAGVATTAGTAVAAVDGSAGALSPNTTYYANATWGRDTYVVVEFARVDSTNVANYDAKLASMVSTTNTKSLAYPAPGATPPTTGTISWKNSSFGVKQKFGFLQPSASATTIRVAKTA
jgi:hypothetical protein